MLYAICTVVDMEGEKRCPPYLERHGFDMISLDIEETCLMIKTGEITVKHGHMNACSC